MLVPFIADEQYGLRDIERREGRIDGSGDDHISERNFVIIKTPAFAPEEERQTLSPADPLPHLGSSLFRRDHFLDHAARPGRSGIGAVKSIKSLIKRAVYDGRLNDPV